MSENNVQRRLAAILAADVAGYSRLMQTDETRTLTALSAVRKIVQTQVAEHRGRIANTAGDSVVAEFSSAVDALSCAMIIQELLVHETASCGDLKIRVGIHLGDIVTKDGDIFGTAVNVAARLENIAQPGGIVVSGGVRDDVAGKLPAVFTNLGTQRLKNIDQPVQAFSVSAQAGGSAAAVAEADQRLGLPQARGISIVVLPFVNMSSDQEHAYLADGLTEDLITELSRLKEFLVIARNTSFTYKDRAVDVALVGRELGVRYVLEGSMRSLGQRVRITAQLIDAKTGTHLWAEKFDRDKSELFDIQDEVVRAVAASTQTRLMLREGEIGSNDKKFECWALSMEALAEGYRMTATSLARSEQMSRQLLKDYPNWPRGYMTLGGAIYHKILMGFAPATPELKEEALSALRRAVSLDPEDEFNLVHLATCIMDFTGDTVEPISMLRRSLEINPNFSLGYGLMGDAFLILGQPDDAICEAEIALRLNPRDPTNFYRYDTLAMACLQKGDDDKALHWASQISALKPDYWSGYAISAAVLAGRSELGQAKRSAEALRKCRPDVSVSAIRAAVVWNDSAWRQRFFKNLVAAGIPE